MGLTIHYKLQNSLGDVSAARNLVANLHQHAQTLPFDKVGNIIELRGDACDFQRMPRDDPDRWLLIQARQMVQLDREGHAWSDVIPRHLIAFGVIAAEGCEPANFGLSVYPKTVVVDGRRVKTGLPAWCWSSFCKTQYASNPQVGGVKNFVRAHLGVVAMLDHAKTLGILGEVSDEGGYFEERDVEALVRTIHEWNAMIAGAVGSLKDALSAAGGDINALKSEITNYPNFEHLEADHRLKRPADSDD